MTSFDMSALSERISELKKQGEEFVDYTYDFLTCLMDRHDLKYSIPEDFTIEDVPENIIQEILLGNIPSKDQLSLMDSDTQMGMIYEFIWACGMNSISYYTNDIPVEDGDISIYDAVLEMGGVGKAHNIASYLIAAYTLLFCRVPRIEFIEYITNDFLDTPEQILKNTNMFIEVAGSLMIRWKEDKLYYANNEP